MVLEQQEGGTWIKRKADEHVCPRPKQKASVPGVAVGDKWRCNGCKTTWEVTGFDSGPQWDSYPTVIQWKRSIERHDPGVTAWRDR